MPKPVLQAYIRNLMAWLVLIIVFLIAGAGFNLFRIDIEKWLAFGRLSDALMSVVGLILGLLATAFLGGFIYFRDKKRGKLTREGWRGRPVMRKNRPHEPKH